MIRTEWPDRLLEAMLNTDSAGAAAIIDRALAEGLPSDRVITEILEPTLAAIGRAWEGKTASLAQIFVSGRIAENALQRCLQPGGSVLPLKGKAVLGNIEEDFHGLGRRLVVSFLRSSGWEVHDLGNDVAAERFVDTALEVGASVVGASAMMRTTALNIRRLRDLIDARGLRDRLKLAVGGAVFTWRPELVAEVGGDGMAGNASGADALFQRLQAEAGAGAGP